MNYLETAEFEQYGVEAETPVAWVAAASALMNAHCRRKSLGVEEYTERVRIVPGQTEVRLSCLPVVQITAARVRYGTLRRGDGVVNEMMTAVAEAFGLPGSWSSLEPSNIDVQSATGEITLPQNALGLFYNEIEVTYTAGCDPLPDAVKAACALAVRNIAATPSLNVRASSIESAHLEYFSGDVLDANTRTLLAPYVAQRVG